MCAIWDSNSSEDSCWWTWTTRTMYSIGQRVLQVDEPRRKVKVGGTIFALFHVSTVASTLAPVRLFQIISLAQIALDLAYLGLV